MVIASDPSVSITVRARCTIASRMRSLLDVVADAVLVVMTSTIHAKT
jgi:hypothetical protein